MGSQKPELKYLKLAEKWLDGTITPEEEKEFAEWYNSGSDETLYIPGSFAANEEIHRDRMLKYILKWKDHQTPIINTKRRKRMYAIAAAAMIAVLLGTLWFYFQPATSIKNQAEAYVKSGQLIEVKNTSPREISITLPDSSTIDLEKGSRISYSKTYNRNNRDLYLEGGAIFDVRHNPILPFAVHAAGLVTKVLGTKFHISAYKDSGQVVIGVLHGKISVSQEKDEHSEKREENIAKSAGFVLNPNQQVTFDVASGKMEKTLVAEPIVLHQFSACHLQYTASPLKVIFRQLENIYGVSIVFDSTVLGECTLTADLSKGSFYDKLEKICIASNLQYSEMDGHILISGRGCNG